MSKVTIYAAVMATLVGVLLSCEQADARILARSAPAVDCCPPSCPTPCITYRHHGRRKACCHALPPIETVLCVTDPNRCGCEVYVPVCIPACCSDCPKVTSRRGALGRGIVTYQYPSGFTIRMVFNRHGDITVHYHGN